MRCFISPTLETKEFMVQVLFTNLFKHINKTYINIKVVSKVQWVNILHYITFEV